MTKEPNKKFELTRDQMQTIKLAMGFFLFVLMLVIDAWVKEMSPFMIAVPALLMGLDLRDLMKK